jgi:Zn-dependent peptidase ImmA (M78 family)
MNNTTDKRSALSRLRALPRGRTTDARAITNLAERQATLLRYLTAGQDAPIEQRIAGMPRIRIELADIPTSGLSHWDGQQWIISINKFEPRTRQRFTVLHEYKHIIDHPDVDVLYQDRQGVTAAEQMEQAADFFAGCALAPTALLSDAWHSGTTSPTALAALFDVSVPAIKVRLWQAGLTTDAARCAPHPPRPSRSQTYYRTAHPERLAA